MRRVRQRTPPARLGAARPEGRGVRHRHPVRRRRRATAGWPSPARWASLMPQVAGHPPLRRGGARSRLGRRRPLRRLLGAGPEAAGTSRPACCWCARPAATPPTRRAATRARRRRRRRRQPASAPAAARGRAATASPAPPTGPAMMSDATRHCCLGCPGILARMRTLLLLLAGLLCAAAPAQAQVTVDLHALDALPAQTAGAGARPRRTRAKAGAAAPAAAQADRPRHSARRHARAGSRDAAAPPAPAAPQARRRPPRRRRPLPPPPPPVIAARADRPPPPAAQAAPPPPPPISDTRAPAPRPQTARPARDFRYRRGRPQPGHRRRHARSGPGRTARRRHQLQRHGLRGRHAGGPSTAAPAFAVARAGRAQRADRRWHGSTRIYVRALGATAPAIADGPPDRVDVVVLGANAAPGQSRHRPRHDAADRQPRADNHDATDHLPDPDGWCSSPPCWWWPRCCRGALLTAFGNNPLLNSLILLVLLIGIGWNLRQVMRPDARGDLAGDVPERARPPRRAAVAEAARADGQHARRPRARKGRDGPATRFTLSAAAMRSLLDGIATRLDESRELSRYMTGLLIFLGLLGTFWGLLQTVGAVSDVIGGMSVGSGDINALFEQLKSGLARPLAGMGTAFSASHVRPVRRAGAGLPRPHRRARRRTASSTSWRNGLPA